LRSAGGASSGGPRGLRPGELRCHGKVARRIGAAPKTGEEKDHADSCSGSGDDCGGAAACRRLRRGGGLFRDRDDRDEAARLLIEREADKERALQQSEDEAEEAQRALDERERQALQEQDEDAERRKREESEDLQQERRHRRELKEAEHDAKLQELYRGSAAPKTPEKLPQHWLDYFSESDEISRAFIEIGGALLDASYVFANPAIHTHGEADETISNAERAFELGSLVAEKIEVSSENLQAAATEHELEVYYKLEKEAEAKAERIARRQDLQTST